MSSEIVMGIGMDTSSARTAQGRNTQQLQAVIIQIWGKTHGGTNDMKNQIFTFYKYTKLWSGSCLAGLYWVNDCAQRIWKITKANERTQGGISDMMATLSVREYWRRRLLSEKISLVWSALCAASVVVLVCFWYWLFSSRLPSCVGAFVVSLPAHVCMCSGEGRWDVVPFCPWLWLSLVSISRFWMVCSYVFFIFFELEVLGN